MNNPPRGQAAHRGELGVELVRSADEVKPQLLPASSATSSGAPTEGIVLLDAHEDGGGLAPGPESDRTSAARDAADQAGQIAARLVDLQDGKRRKLVHLTVTRSTTRRRRASARPSARSADEGGAAARYRARRSHTVATTVATISTV